MIDEMAGEPNQENPTNDGSPTPTPIPKQKEVAQTQRTDSQGHNNAPKGKDKISFCAAFRKWVRRTTFSDTLMVLLTAVIAVITAVYTHYAKRQWDEMHRATDASVIAANAAAEQSQISARQLELTERPWVSIAVIPKTDLVQDAMGVHMTVHVILKNSGPTPAKNVFVNSELLPEQLGDSGARAKELCNELANQLASTKELLFPNVDQGEDIPVGFRWMDVRETAHLEPEIGVCVVYGPTFRDGPRYATWEIYEFDRQIPLNTNVPLREIHLSPGKWGGAE